MPNEDQIAEWDRKKLKIIREILERRSLNDLENISDMPNGQLERLVALFKSIKNEAERELQRRKKGYP